MKMAIKNRNIVTCILLTLITCGIYGIYWIVMMTKEAVSVKDPADSAILEIVLMLLLPFVGFFLTEKKFAEGCAARGIAHEDRSILYLILGILGFGIVNYCLMQNDLNQIATV
jgi:cytochrome bd-type quinol oxidase subunit 2